MYYLYMYLYINWLSINERLPKTRTLGPANLILKVYSKMPY